MKSFSLDKITVHVIDIIIALIMHKRRLCFLNQSVNHLVLSFSQFFASPQDAKNNTFAMAKLTRRLKSRKFRFNIALYS